MPKDPHLTSLSRLLGPSLPSSLGRRLPSKELARAWLELVGPTLAAKARPVALEQGGILVVAVKGAMWRQELSFRAPEMLDSLNQKGLGLSRIKLVLDRSQQPAPPPIPELPELDDVEEGLVQNSVAQVKDPKLKEALAGVARAALRARKGGHI